jgi:hypothetical protein
VGNTVPWLLQVVALLNWQLEPVKPGAHWHWPVDEHVPLPLQVVDAEQKVQAG